MDVPPELQPFIAGDEVVSNSPGNIYRDKTPYGCLRSQSFWFLVFTSAVCSGAGLTLLNNTAQMVRLWTPRSWDAILHRWLEMDTLIVAAALISLPCIAPLLGLLCWTIQPHAPLNVLQKICAGHVCGVSESAGCTAG
jgi:hypothetical protein